MTISSSTDLIPLKKLSNSLYRETLDNIRPIKTIDDMERFLNT